MNLEKEYDHDQGHESPPIPVDKIYEKEQISGHKCVEYFTKGTEGHSEFSRKRGRPCNSNAARERSRVKTLRTAFRELQQTLPSVPPDTKLSKLDVLVLATTYISHLMRTLEGEQDGKIPFSSQGFMHPVKKWPMRTRLYAGILASTDRASELRSSTSPKSGPYRCLTEWSQ